MAKDPSTEDPVKAALDQLRRLAAEREEAEALQATSSGQGAEAAQATTSGDGHHPPSLEIIHGDRTDATDEPARPAAPPVLRGRGLQRTASFLSLSLFAGLAVLVYWKVDQRRTDVPASAAIAREAAEPANRGPAVPLPGPEAKPAAPAVAAPSLAVASLNPVRAAAPNRPFRHRRTAAGHSPGRGRPAARAARTAARDADAGGKSRLPVIRKKQISDDPLGGLNL
jgi:hypothetical protein